MPSKVERWLASQAKKQEGTATDKIRADRALDSGSEEFRVGAELDRYVGKASALAPYTPAPTTTEQPTYVEQTPLERKEQTLVSAARQRAEKRKTAGDDYYKKEYGMTKAEYDKEYDAIDRMSAVREARSDMQEIEDAAKARTEEKVALAPLVKEYKDAFIGILPESAYAWHSPVGDKEEIKEDIVLDYLMTLPAEKRYAQLEKAAFINGVDKGIKDLEALVDQEEALTKDISDYDWEDEADREILSERSRAKERLAKLEQLRDLRESVKNNDFTSGWAEAADIRDLGTLGFASLASDASIFASLKKAEQGQPLTFDDQYNIKIAELKQGLEEIRKWRGGASFLNSLGSGAAHSTQFAAETVMTGGLGGAAKLATGGIKQAFKQGIRQGLKQLAFKNVPRTIVYGAKRSPLMAGTYRNLMDRRINQYSVANGQVDLTNPESLWKSIGVAWTDQTFEIASELWGNMLHLGFGKIGKAIGADKWLKTKSVSFKTTPAMRRVLRDGLLWSGDMPSEITSEFLGDVATNLAYSAFNEDEQYWGELFTWNYWGNLLALTAGLKAGVTVASIPSIVDSNKKVKQLEARSAEAFNAIGNEELKNKVLNLGGRTDIEDVAEYMHSIDWSQYEPMQVAHAIDYMMSEVERQVVAGSEAEQERAERYAPRLERIQELAYRNAEGVAMPTMVTAEANFGADNTQGVTILEGDYANPEAMVRVRLADGTTDVVLGEKLSNVQETDMSALVAEDYAMTFAEEDAMETLGEVEQTLFDMQRTGASNTQQIRAVEKSGLTVFNEGEVVTLLNGEEATVVEGFRHGLYTVMRADGSLSMVGVGGILQPDVAMAQAQRSAAMPQEQTPLTQSTPLPEGIDTTTDYATPDGFVGKAVDYNAESDQVTLQSADGGLTNVPRASLTVANAEQTAPQEDATENLATETISEMERGEAEETPMPVAPQTAPIPQNADGSVDYESMTDATMYANALESDMGNVADAQEAVADVRQSKEAELAKLQEQKKQTANMNEKVALKQQEQKLVQQIAMLNEVESILGSRATAVEAETAQVNEAVETAPIAEATTEQTAPTTEPTRAIVEGVKDNYLATQLRNENPAEYNTFNALAKLLGLEIEFVESAGEGNALIVGNKMQVAYNPANREETLRFLIGHESLHRLKQVAPEAYAELMEDVKSYIGEELFGQRVERLRLRYEHQGITITEESLEEEVVADFIGEMEEDYNVVSDLATQNPNKSWWQKLIEGLRNLFSFLEEAEADTTKVASILNKIETAYKAAAEKVQTLEVEKPVTTTTEAAEVRGAKLSIKTEAHLESNLRKFATSKEGKRAGWTPQKVDSIIEETKALINAIDAALRGNSFYDAFADREPTIRTDWRDGVMKPTVTWTRANIEYKYDMSADLLCINNDGIENVLASAEMVGLMKLLPTKATKEGGKVYDLAITADDYLTLYDIMDKMGYVVPCKGCFDAAGRFKMLPSVAQKFVADVNATIDERNANPEKFDEGVRKMVGKKGVKTIEGLPAKAETKKDAIRIGVAGDKATQHLDWTDFMSAEGQAKMLETYGGIFRAWQRTGAGRPKDKLPAEPYYGDIMSNTTTIIGKFGEKTPSFREVEVNQGTGLRRNSHSEFRPILAVDEIQFMRDAFIRGLFVFKYMKELDDVRLFGNMGVKFNISFFPAFVEGGKAAGLDANGNYIASEESAGAREFAYEGEDGNIHYDGMKGWEEAKKYTNEDVSLSSVVFSIPHLIKALTDVPTPTNKDGEWGSLIPFHPSGATGKQLTAQGLGNPRAMGTSFDEAMYDYDKGVTNFEHVQNDRFGEGWVVVAGEKAGTKVKAGHKIEFVNGNHYFNAERGLHLFSSGYIVDSELTNEQRDALINGEKKERKAVKKEMIHPFVVDYNDKVREIGTPYAYKEAADYYIKALRDLGLLPRFEFEVKEDVFLKMCADANVDPRHLKLGWKGEGHSWSPTDAESYYSLFCDYGMTNPETGEWSPHRAVGYINENGEREFRLPDNAVEIVKEGLDTYTARRNKETAMDREAIRAFADKMVEQGRLTEKQVNEVLGEDIKYSLIGEKGASALDAFEESTTRLDNLNVAREMEASGKDAKTIKMATGWERGVDGLWRYEIEEDIPKDFFTKNIDTETTLGEVLGHNHYYFKAYPSLADIKVFFSSQPHTEAGIFGGYNPIDRTLLMFNSGENLETFVHEIQHAIQVEEGFAIGGGEENFRFAGDTGFLQSQQYIPMTLLKDNSKRQYVGKETAIKYGVNSDFLDILDKDKLRNSYEARKNEIPELFHTTLEYIIHNPDIISREQSLPIIQKVVEDAIAKAKSVAHEKYRRIAGEVEARNIEARLNMTPEERLASLVKETEDVAREDQIILRWGLIEGAKFSLRNPEWQSQFGVPLADGKELSLEDVRTLFEKTNKRKVLQQMFDKVYEVMEKLPYYGIIVTSQMPEGSEDSLGVADGKGNILLNVRMFQEISNKGIATTILHEMIHSATTYATIAYEERKENPEAYKALPENIKTACQRLQNIYDFLLKRNNLKEEYGMTSIHEMLAELSNPQFRALLREEGVWEKLVNALKRFFGIGTGKTVKELDETLKTFLENFDRSAYVETVEAIAGEKVFERKVDAKETDNQGKEVKYSLKELDAPYLDAVARGDMETAQRMVREVAAIAMPNTKVVDEDGLPKIVEHSTWNDDFYTFDINHLGESSGDEGVYGAGFYFGNVGETELYGDRAIQVYLNLHNPLVLPDAPILGFFDYLVENFDKEGLRDIVVKQGNNTATMGDVVDAIKAVNEAHAQGEYAELIEQMSQYWMGAEGRVLEQQIFRKIGFAIYPTLEPFIQYNVGRKEFSEALRNAGYDGVVYDNQEYIAFEPNQIKSADTVTYDDNGNIIPLSERFNPENEDIRYSLREATGEEVKEYLADALRAAYADRLEQIDKRYDYIADTAKKGRRPFIIGDMDAALALVAPDGKEGLSLELQIAYDIANGLKFRWANSEGGIYKGLQEAIGDRKSVAGILDAQEGAYLNEYATRLAEQVGMSAEDVQKVVVNVVRNNPSRKAAIKTLGENIPFEYNERVEQAIEDSRARAKDKEKAKFEASLNSPDGNTPYARLMQDEAVEIVRASDVLRDMRAEIRGLRKKHAESKYEQAVRIETMRKRITDMVGTYFGRNMNAAEIKTLINLISKAHTPEALERALDMIQRQEFNVQYRMQRQRKGRLLQNRISFAFTGNEMSVEQYLRQEGVDDATIKRLLSNRFKGVDAKGISVAKFVSAEVAKLMELVNNNINLTKSIKEQHSDFVNALNEAMQKVPAALLNNETLRSAIETLPTIMLMYWQVDEMVNSAKTYEEDLKKLNDKIKEAEEAITFRPENMSDEAYEERTDQFSQVLKELIQLRDALMRQHLADMPAIVKLMTEANNAIEQMLLGGKQLLSEERKALERHKREVLQDAEMDITNYGQDYNALRADATRHKTSKERAKKEEKKRGFLSGIMSETFDSLDQMLRKMGSDSASGMGRTHQRIIGGLIQATNLMRDNINDVDDAINRKLRQLWGGRKGYRSLEDIIYQSQKIIVGSWNYARVMNEARIVIEAGKPRTVYQEQARTYNTELTLGQALYVLSAWNQADGRLKLEHNGFTQDDINSIMRAIADVDARWLDLMDFVIDELLPSRRDYYDEVHRRVNGAYMARVENYFPLKISGEEVYKEADLDAMSITEATIIPSAIINRTHNTKMIDLDVDFFKVLLENVTDMERWAAMVEIRQDMTTILSDTRTRNMMEQKYGVNFVTDLERAMKVAVGTYTCKIPTTAEKALLYITRRWAGSRIAGRISTALKQLVGIGAYGTYATSWAYWLKVFKVMRHPVQNIKEALEMFPMLQQRWKSASSGDVLLQQFNHTVNVKTEGKLEWKQFDAWLDKVTRLGIMPNAAVDLFVSAVMAKATYEWEMERYLNQGLSREIAEQKAKIDAELSYNLTQQSAETMFIGSLQASPSLVSRAATTFMNNPIANIRLGMQGFADIKRALKWQRVLHNERNRLAIEYRKQFIAEGMDEERAGILAEQKALREVQKTKKGGVVWRGINKMLWGYFLNATTFTLAGGIWLLCKYWDDDEKLDEMGLTGTDLLLTTVASPFQAIPVAKQLTDLLIYGKTSFIPMLDDALREFEGLRQYIENDNVSPSAVYAFSNAVLSLSVGVDMNTWINMADGVVDMFNGDWDAGVAKLINKPKSQIKLLIGDRKDGETAKEYMTRVMRTMSIVDKNKIDVAELENYNFEVGKWEKPANISDAEKRKVNEIYRQYQAEYKKDMLKRCSEEVSTYYPEVVEKHAEILKDMGVKDTKLALVKYYEQMVDTLTPDAASALERLAVLQAEISATERNLDLMVSQDGKEYIDLLTEEFNLRKEFVAQYEIYKNLTK